jgi:hypothetical protein
LLRVAEAVGDRFMWLDFDAYLAKPDFSFDGMCHSLQLNWTDEDSAASEMSGLRNRYSKDSSVSFASETRLSQITEILVRQAVEVNRARTWVDAAMKAHPEFGALAVLR